MATRSVRYTAQGGVWSGQPPAAQRTIGQWLSDARAGLALLGIGLYAVLRLAYARFYAPFGLSPDELGFGYLELLAQSALGALVLLLLFALLAWIYVAFLVAVGQDLVDDVRPALDFVRRRLGPGELAQVARIALAVVALALLTLLLWLIGTDLLIGVAIAGVIVYWAVWVARGSRRILRGIGRPADRPRPSAGRRWRRGLAWTAVVPVLLAGTTLVTQANMDAQAVREGRATHPDFLGVRLTSWGADPATLVWTGAGVEPALRPLAASCVMYLGQSGGTIFVTQGGATFRVPASLAAVRIVPGGRCRPGARMPAR
ncbi:MAG TPA: hypothetical protein VGV67_11050 [Solirubrobacteraceae bacterium]|nr:hypothetical protein [Solirubrobacteraceae bacterium]